MPSRFAAVLLAAACLPPALVPVNATAQATISPEHEIVLSTGRGELVEVPGRMTDVFIANEAVADVEIKSQRQLYLLGRASGETTIYASNAAGDIIWSATVRVGANLGSVGQMLALAMPEAKIEISTIGAGTMLLTGTVAAPDDAAEAERLVAAFVGEGTPVISRLRVATPLQVNLRVRFAEVSRSLARAIGANLASHDGTGGFRFAIGQGRDFSPRLEPDLPGLNTVDNPDGGSGTVIDPIRPGTTIAGLGKFLGLDLLGALDLAEREGLVSTLAEPNLTALSGETAHFLSGGEFPIPLSQGLGTTTIEYKNYGVSLAYSPTVLASGRISMRVRPEVSELSNQGAVVLNGYQVPALTIRRAETTIELGSGQSFMIAGLLNNSAQTMVDKVPGAGDVPILGSLFRSSEFQRGQTELVIVVTPYLVQPTDDREIRLPTDGLRSPTLTEQFLLNRDVDMREATSRPLPHAIENIETRIHDSPAPPLATDPPVTPGSRPE